MQLLLCVGEFFGATPEAEAEWHQYKTGAKKGSVSTSQTRLTRAVGSLETEGLFFLFSAHPHLHLRCSESGDGEELLQL